MRAQLTALAVLLVHAWLLIVGTPALELLGTSRLKRPDQIATAQEKYGAPWADILVELAAFNRAWRHPLAKKIGGPQRVFRISQSFHLYRDGPSRVRRLEVHVDGALWFRSGDPAHDWLRPALTHRRMRPVVETTTKKKEVKNRAGLYRYIVGQALEAKPTAQEVRFVSVQAKFPARDERTRHSFVARAPDWTLEAE